MPSQSLVIINTKLYNYTTQLSKKETFKFSVLKVAFTVSVVTQRLLAVWEGLQGKESPFQRGRVQRAVA